MILSLKRPARFRPRAPRTGVDIATQILLPDDRLIDATVRNVSELGFLAICDTELAAGTWLGVALPGYGIARAVVRWNEDGELGCQFRRPLSDAAIERSTGRSGSLRTTPQK
ncbi:hypothetical protein [Tsuneonella sp. HG222]